MPTPLQVRRAAPEDYVAVAELTAVTYLAEGWADEDYAEQLRDVAARNSGAQVLVAAVSGVVVGAVTVATRGGPFAELAGDGEAVVRHLVTSPAARGRGVGDALVRACLDLARADDCRVVRLSTHSQMHTAHRLYGRLGFVRTPADDWSPVPGLDLITYALPLVPWCDRCGQQLTTDHPRVPVLEPPRWCAHCRRRLVVQITPTGWSARCVEHGTRTG